MRKKLVSSNFKSPQNVKIGEDYYLVPISADIATEDWLILTSNAETIVKTRGGGSREEWPYVCTLEENFKDLSWLEICANYNQLFSYILRRKFDDAYVGCIYIYPIELFYEDKAEDYDVDFSFWIVESEYKNGNYDQIFKNLLNWLKEDWPFDEMRIFLRNKLIPKDLK